jgi:hypothetical protein
MKEFYSETVMVHSFIEDGVPTDTVTVTTQDDCWPEIFRHFIQMLKGGGYFPNREGFEMILDEIYGCPESDECCGECDCEPDF